MKSDDDVKNCKTDGIPNEYLKNPKLADEARQKFQIRNLDKFVSVKDAFRPIPDIGYESPITMMASQMETKIENDTMSVIQQYGIDVDKDELIKALNYDRQQYEKGYKDRGEMIVPVALMVTEPYRVHRITGYLDKATQMIYTRSITVEAAEALGWRIIEQ